MHRGMTVDRPGVRSDAQRTGYKTEHLLAYALAAVAVVLTTAGLLRGFGVVGGGGINDTGAPGTREPGFRAIWDAAMWLLPALSAAILSMALHSNDHHRLRDPEGLPDDEEGMWKGEHGLAYFMAGASVIFAALGMGVGFDLFDRGNDQPDALPWLLASLVAALLANTLHAVRHHQLAYADRELMAHAHTPEVEYAPVSERLIDDTQRVPRV